MSGSSTFLPGYTVVNPYPHSHRTADIYSDGRSRHRFRNAPDRHFDNSSVIEQESIAVDQCREGSSDSPALSSAPPGIGTDRLALTARGNVRYDAKGFTNVAGAGCAGATTLKTPYRDGTTHIRQKRGLCPFFRFYYRGCIPPRGEYTYC